ncbi:MAG TPA: hypothetical protein VGK88_12000 [bacterium]|jgi:hypothetical protein
MNWLARIFAEVARIAEYDEAAEREYRRLRGGSHVDNRFNAAERFIDERQYEAMRVVDRVRLQREATRATWEGHGRQGGFSRLAAAFRRALGGTASQQVPIRVEIRK